MEQGAILHEHTQSEQAPVVSYGESNATFTVLIATNLLSSTKPARSISSTWSSQTPHGAHQ
jgi:hypothetical protein